MPLCAASQVHHHMVGGRYLMALRRGSGGHGLIITQLQHARVRRAAQVPGYGTEH